MKTKEIKKCECKSLIEDMTHGEIRCKKCGLVVDNIIVPETFSDSNAPFVKGLVTEWGSLSGVNPNKKAQFVRMTKWQNRSTKSKDKRIKDVYNEVSRMTSILLLPDAVKETVIEYYEKAQAKELTKGRPGDAVLSGLFHIILKERSIPHTYDDLEYASGVHEKEIKRTYRKIARGLGKRILPG